MTPSEMSARILELQEKLRVQVEEHEREKAEDRKDKALRMAAAALAPFARFAEAFAAAPINGLADELYGIHGGEFGHSGLGASLHLSSCQSAVGALKAVREALNG